MLVGRALADTALHMAAGYGSPEIAHLLLSFGETTMTMSQAGSSLICA